MVIYFPLFVLYFCSYPIFVEFMKPILIAEIFFPFNSFISTLTKTTYNVKQILQYNTYITTMSYTKHPTNNYVTFLIIFFFFHNHSYFIYNTSYLYRKYNYLINCHTGYFYY